MSKPKETEQDEREGMTGTPPDGAGAPTEGAGAVETPPDVTDTPTEGEKKTVTLRRGLHVAKPLMRGDDVRAVQDALIARGNHCGADIDKGIYGGATAAAVRYFQAMNRLIVNGRVNARTAAALGLAWDEKK